VRLVWGTVLAVTGGRAGIQHLRVAVDVGGHAAVCYSQLTGVCSAGDRVLLNTTAVDLALGTGGVHFVVTRVPGASSTHDAGSACLKEEQPQGDVLADPSGGHIMKLRYTPLQRDVVSVEAPESPHHEAMARAVSADGLPVVCCGLHSQVPLVAAAVKRADPALRVVYCMTDQAALALAFSEIVASALEAGLIDATVTCGQAFGGGIEAVTTHSGLLAARHVLAADVAIVAIGPGVVGTATPFGHGGVAQGEAINAAASVSGLPIACLRLSFADTRERHRGVSHHTLTALTRVAMAHAIVAVPSLEEEQSRAVYAALLGEDIPASHEIVASAEGTITPPPLHGLTVTTMGRGPDQNPAFFSAAFAAGDVASRLALGTLD